MRQTYISDVIKVLSYYESLLMLLPASFTGFLKQYEASRTRRAPACRSHGAYLSTTPPFVRGCEEISDNVFVLAGSGNRRFPLPKRTGAIPILYSSKRSSLINVADKPALPNTYRSCSASDFNRASSATMFS